MSTFFLKQLSIINFFSPQCYKKTGSYLNKLEPDSGRRNLKTAPKLVFFFFFSLSRSFPHKIESCLAFQVKRKLPSVFYLLGQKITSRFPTLFPLKNTGHYKPLGHQTRLERKLNGNFMRPLLAGFFFIFYYLAALIWRKLPSWIEVRGGVFGVSRERWGTYPYKNVYFESKLCKYMYDLLLKFV